MQKMHVPNPTDVVDYVEAWEKFCGTYGDIVYNVLLSGQSAQFPTGTLNHMFYQKALAQGEKILTNCFMPEEKFLEELKENPLF